MFNRIFHSSLFAAFVILIGVSSLNAQDMSHKEMMKKHKESAAIDLVNADANGDGSVFVCSMVCAVVDTAGRCPVCEMKLNEMSVADAESMLKEKGFNVVDHSAVKMGMKKDCKPGCDKPCCAKKGMADTKEYKPGCEKPCCAKKAMTDAESCKPGCEKPCCAKKAMTDAESCKPGCEKPCCAKKENAVSDAKAFNKVCPMSGGPVEASVQTVSYMGKNYGFCGSGCVAHFQADPEKFSKNLSENGAKFVSSSM